MEIAFTYLQCEVGHEAVVHQTRKLCPLCEISQLKKKIEMMNGECESCSLTAWRDGRIAELEDLLVSAHAIARRHGTDTAWDRFSIRLQNYGIGSVTAKTFRILEDKKS